MSHWLLLLFKIKSGIIDSSLTYCKPRPGLGFNFDNILMEMESSLGEIFSFLDIRLYLLLIKSSKYSFIILYSNESLISSNCNIKHCCKSFEANPGGSRC